MDPLIGSGAARRPKHPKQESGLLVAARKAGATEGGLVGLVLPVVARRRLALLCARGAAVY
jgi:hypothetical protein